MRSRNAAFALAALLLASLPAAPAAAVPAPPTLEMYTAVVDEAGARDMARSGLDLATVHARDDGRVEVSVVLSESELGALVQTGVSVEVWRGPDGQTATELAAAQQQAGYAVWRPFDGPDGLRQHVYELADRFPDLVSLQVLGTSVQDREILAIKVTKDARRTPDGARPSVLYLSGQHAREWIGLEVNRRLLHHFLDGYGADVEVTRLVDTRELWFVLAANPDGYEYSFGEGSRLWRKNLRDNDGDGRITGADGVDLNRNFPAHWGYDNHGSSPSPTSESYRGPGPASEPETVALMGLLDRVPFAFAVNYHSVAQLLLYPVGWMEHARSADTALFEALAGTSDNPAIPGYAPIASWRLYPTNGETCDYAYGERGVVCFTPEMSDGGSGQGFVFPDDPQLVARELAINLPFASSLARSAADPARPDTHLGLEVPPLQVEPFPVSYGDPQPVQAIAGDYLGPITMHWQVDDAPERTAPAEAWSGGRRYGDKEAVHYRWVRGEVTGTAPGDHVSVWFSGGGAVSDRFTYEVASTGQARLLVLAAEDYTGTWPTYERTDRPTYLGAYLASLEAMNREADVYDVDARRRTAPSHLGVLSHYDAVIWYTGDDFLTTQGPEGLQRAPALSRLPLDTMLAVRDYLNEGGRLLLAGARAGEQFVDGYAFQVDPEVPCDPRRGGCGYLTDTFLHQYLGAAEYLSDLGVAGDRRLFDARGETAPLEGLAWSFGTRPSVTATHAAAWVPTSRRLSAAEFPLFVGRLAARYDWPGLEPRSGAHALYSDWQRYGWTRLAREVDLTSASSATLDLWVSRETLPELGWFFVEAHTLGENDWTMLADENGHTSADSGDYCLLRIQDYLHPHLHHYLTRVTDGESPSCISVGSSGMWNAASGHSGGWEAWHLDVGRFAGRRMELVVSYLAGPRPRLGVLLDDLVLTVDGVADTTTFEDDLGPWAAVGPPSGSRTGSLRFARVGPGFLPAGPIVLTEDTALVGFEPAHIEDPAQRTALLERLLAYLAPRPGPAPLFVPAAYTGRVD